MACTHRRYAASKTRTQERGILREWTSNRSSENPPVLLCYCLNRSPYFDSSLIKTKNHATFVLQWLSRSLFTRNTTGGANLLRACSGSFLGREYHRNGCW